VVSISSTELSLLLYLRSVVGAGRITSKVRARDHHSRAFAYTIYSRQALTLLGRVWPYLRTYKAGRACLLVEEYVRVTPRNGRYTPHQRAARQAFEQRFFAKSVRAKAHVGREPAAAAFRDSRAAIRVSAGLNIARLFQYFSPELGWLYPPVPRWFRTKPRRFAP